MSSSSVNSGQSVQLKVPVANRGKRPGHEVVQVYVRKVGDVDGPLKTLRSYKRVEVLPGKTQLVDMELPYSSFEFYDWGQRRMAVTPGEYEVYYGNSSAAADLKMVKVTIR